MSKLYSYYELTAYIAEAIENSGIAKATEYDLDFIAEVVSTYESIKGREGFMITVDQETFWNTVKNAVL